MVNEFPGQYDRLWDDGFRVRYYHRMPAKREHVRHTFVYNCLMVMSEGRGTIRHGSRSWALAAPFIFLARPGETYHYGPEGTWSETGFVIDHDPRIGSLDTLPFAPQPLKASDIVLLHLSTIERLMGSLALPTAVDQIDLLAKSILTTGFFGTGEDLPEGPQRRLFALEAWLRANYPKPFELKTLIRRFGFSEPTFRRLWRENFATSPWQHILAIRIAAAERMLALERDATIGEIAYRCGFKDQRYFSTVYKRIRGRTPRQYRDLVDSGQR